MRELDLGLSVLGDAKGYLCVVNEVRCRYTGGEEGDRGAGVSTERVLSSGTFSIIELWASPGDAGIINVRSSGSKLINE